MMVAGDEILKSAFPASESITNKNKQKQTKTNKNKQKQTHEYQLSSMDIKGSSDWIEDVKQWTAIQK